MSETSPCIGCPNELRDKRACLNKCPRLKAFQDNKSFRHIPYYQKPIKCSQIVSLASEPPKTIKPINQINQKTNWRKTIPKKKTKPKKKIIKKSEVKKSMEDPVKYEKTVKNKNESVTPAMNQEKLILHSITLDFTNYQKIYDELKTIADKLMLPMSHIIFNTLSLGLFITRADEKESNTNAK